MNIIATYNMNIIATYNMNDYRYVYYIQPGYLHILIEKILKHNKFQILNDEQKEKIKLYIEIIIIIIKLNLIN